MTITVLYSTNFLPIRKSNCCLTSTAADMLASGAIRLLQACVTDLQEIQIKCISNNTFILVIPAHFNLWSWLWLPCSLAECIYMMCSSAAKFLCWSKWLMVGYWAYIMVRNTCKVQCFIVHYTQAQYLMLIHKPQHTLQVFGNKFKLYMLNRNVNPPWCDFWKSSSVDF